MCTNTMEFQRCYAYELELRQHPEYERGIMSYEEWNYAQQTIEHVRAAGTAATPNPPMACACQRCRNVQGPPMMSTNRVLTAGTGIAIEHAEGGWTFERVVPAAKGITAESEEPTISIGPIARGWREVRCPHCQRMFCEVKMPMDVRFEVFCPGCVAEGRQILEL